MRAFSRGEAARADLHGQLNQIQVGIAYIHRPNRPRGTGARHRAFRNRYVACRQPRHHGLQQTEAGERLVGVRDQAITTGLVAADGVLVHHQHAFARLGEHSRTGRAGGTGADDED